MVSRSLAALARRLPSSGMDVVKTPVARRKQRVLAWGLTPAMVLGAWLVLDRWQRAVPSIERESLWVGVVERGELMLSVRGPGRLVPEKVQWLSAAADGRVERVLADVGAVLEPGTPLVQLANEDLVLRKLEAQRELAAAEAELVNLTAQLQTERLAQQATVASTRAELKGARREREAHRELEADGLFSKLELQGDEDRVEELQILLGIEEERLALFDQVEEARIAAQRANVERLQALADFRAEKLRGLLVPAGVHGVLQELPLEDGQWVTAGTLLAKVVQPEELKAEVRIPQARAREIRVGQSALIDCRTATITGQVARIDPSVVEGTVLIDVALEGELPAGARPDMSIEGEVELLQLEDVLHVTRPAFGQAQQEVSLFLLSERDTQAVRRPVAFGRASARAVEVREGLEEGDRIVLNDMSRWQGEDRLQVK